MNIFLDEIVTTPNSTLSLVFLDNKQFCFTIEDGYRDIKVDGETRIPGHRAWIQNINSNRRVATNQK